MYIANMLEGIGVLVRKEYVDVSFVALLMSGMVKRYWETFEPVIQDFRESWNWPRSFAKSNISTIH